jgi:hypothetical protein
MSTPPRTVSLGAYREALVKLLMGWKSRTGQLRVPAEKRATAHMVVPWTAQVHRFGRAYLQLARNGLEHEAHPIARSALEFAITGHWAAHVGDKAVTARYGRDQDKLKRLVEDMGGTPKDVVPPQWKAEVFAAAIDPTPVPLVDERKAIDNFEQICRDLGIHSNIYSMYRIFCWSTHPTTHAATPYLGGELKISDVPLYPAKRSVGLVGPMTFAVFWSRRTVDDLAVDHPYESWLDEIAQSIEVAPRLPPPRTYGAETPCLTPPPT